MPRTTIVRCDGKDCTQSCEIKEEADNAVFEIIQVIDAMGKSVWFCGISCLRTWAAKYESPYKRPEPVAFIPLDAILPGAKTN